MGYGQYGQQQGPYGYGQVGFPGAPGYGGKIIITIFSYLINLQEAKFFLVI